MKKNKILAAALLAAVLKSGCAGINSPSGTEREKIITTADMTETSSRETSVSTDTAVTEATKGGTDIETDWLEKLTEIVPPPDDPKCTGTAEMRAAAEKRLGAKLPDDYIEGSSKNLLSFRRADIKSADCTNFSQAYCRMSRKICAI